MSIITALTEATMIAFSFLTALPVRRVEWTSPRLRFLPIALPVVGCAVGALGGVFFFVLFQWRISTTLKSTLMALFYLAVTGGLHMDGLMDTCDAVFSRQNRETRLAILSDTHAGAFAVMGCAAVLLLKVGAFSELLLPLVFWKPSFPLVVLGLIPVYSRLGLGLLFYLPFAREDGLARTLGGARVLRDRYALVAFCVLSSLPLLPLFTGNLYFAVPLAGFGFLLLYGRYCINAFGGITGDLMGAYVELSETLMLLTLATVANL